ncbi:hypothetical protein ACFX5Q_34165 [Mesorhizobium sp. IMUNJ 23033]|uniref:hypothetical protein n=1 Tax=Mesorhizobium sp. IMUNJ 23033 TaxID=3378039 RepID=UPI0038502D22
MSGRFAALAIAGGIAGLCAVNASLYNRPVNLAPIASAKARDGAVATGVSGSLQLSNAGDFSETFARPLFSPSRRKFVPEPVAPPPAEVAADAAPQPPAQSLPEVAPAAAPSLLGISIHGGAAKALLRQAGSDATHWYGKDETVDDWRVSVIEKDGAVLERNGKVTRILLYPPGPPNQAAPAASAAE